MLFAQCVIDLRPEPTMHECGDNNLKSNHGVKQAGVVCSMTVALPVYEGTYDNQLQNLPSRAYPAVMQAGRQSDLPKGSVKLGASQTGATQVGWLAC